MNITHKIHLKNAQFYMYLSYKRKDTKKLLKYSKSVKNLKLYFL